MATSTKNARVTESSLYVILGHFKIRMNKTENLPVFLCSSKAKFLIQIIRYSASTSAYKLVPSVPPYRGYYRAHSTCPLVAER